jgi:hypothetical protein
MASTNAGDGAALEDETALTASGSRRNRDLVVDLP